MRFDSYLLTENRKKKLTEDDFFDILKSKCSNAIKNDNVSIYRGMKGIDNFYHIRGLDSEIERMSANAHFNVYNLLFSNLQSWSNFPKRSKSIICSTAYGAASAYGHSVYKIFPFDDTKIGVSPESDIWYTFPQYGTIELFNEGFRKLIESFLDYNFINNIKSYNELLKLCNEIDKVKINYLKNKEPEKCMKN